MLYGDRFMFPDGWPYEATDIQYGIDKITITDVVKGTYEVPAEEDDSESADENNSEPAVETSEAGAAGEAGTEEEAEVLEGYYIYGENFNQCTFVWMDDAFDSNTIYIDRNTMFLPTEKEFENGTEISIAQVGDDSIDFGVEDTFVYGAAE
jgi:hypothetical protein